MMKYELKDAIGRCRDKKLSEIFHKAFLYTKFILILVIYKKKWRKWSIDRLVEFSFTACNGIIKPLQVREEITELLQILKKKKPKTIIEIGTHIGGNLFLLCQVAANDALIISIDLPGGPFGGGYPIWRKPLFYMFLSPKQKLVLIRASSHSQETYEKAANSLKGKTVDYIFIDGDHTYEGVKKDWQIYSNLLDKDGILGFHDIVPHKKIPSCKVNEFWSEIKIDTKWREIVRSMDQGWAGIGLIENTNLEKHRAC